MILLVHPERALIWAAHPGACVRDFFAQQRRRLMPLVSAMRRYDQRTWNGLSIRIGAACFLDMGVENPHRFTAAVQDALNALGNAPMRAVCETVGVSQETFFSWYDDLQAVLRAFNMEPQAAVHDPVGPRLRLVSSTPPSA